jgi:TPR repeat protein
MSEKRPANAIVRVILAVIFLVILLTIWKFSDTAVREENRNLEAGVGAVQAGRYSEAAKSFAMAADRGFAPAQGELGFLYARGLGVPKDDLKASRLFRLAAIRGNAKAQFNLAFMIHTDRADANSVLVDDQTFQEMLVWYRKAAAQGYQPALYNLIVILRDAGERERKEEAERWNNDSAEESKRWKTAYQPNTSLLVSAVPVPLGTVWRDDAWSKTEVDAELERCKRYVGDQGSLESAGECFLHAYTLGIISARRYLEQIAARQNLLGQLSHSNNEWDEAEDKNLKSVTLYEAIGNVAAAGPVHATLAVIWKRKGDRMKACKYAYRSRDLLTAANNQSIHTGKLPMTIGIAGRKEGMDCA